MDFVRKLYGNTYAVRVTVALVGVATLNLALPSPPAHHHHHHPARTHTHKMATLKTSIFFQKLTQSNSLCPCI